MDSSDWVDKLRRHDPDAFAEFVERFGRQVLTCCATLGIRGPEAEEVSAETFWAIWQALPGFQGKASLSTWVWSITYRQGIDYWRSKRAKDRSVADEDAVLAAAAGDELAAGENLDRCELGERVWSAVRQLPPDWSTAVVLFYREEKTTREIAAILDKPENTVKTYLHRARRRLKELLGPQLGEEVKCPSTIR